MRCDYYLAPVYANLTSHTALNCILELLHDGHRLIAGLRGIKIRMKSSEDWYLEPNYYIIDVQEIMLNNIRADFRA